MNTIWDMSNMYFIFNTVPVPICNGYFHFIVCEQHLNYYTSTLKYVWVRKCSHLFLLWPYFKFFFPIACARHSVVRHKSWYIYMIFAFLNHVMMLKNCMLSSPASLLHFLSILLPAAHSHVVVLRLEPSLFHLSLAVCMFIRLKPYSNAIGPSQEIPLPTFRNCVAKLQFMSSE